MTSWIRCSGKRCAVGLSYTQRTEGLTAASGLIRRGSNVFKGNKKSLPVRYCQMCKKPMSWRKKWERCWEEVKYCSERCRRAAHAQRRDQTENDPL
ncbi:DUF2256 domain-containing protein [Pantoea anthophila]|nr:DUF2256 domain-containing protein [Pantoea anthophila]WIM54702.1 DUF2256 domain-containing protein [Pantoea anthophila]